MNKILTVLFSVTLSILSVPAFAENGVEGYIQTATTEQSLVNELEVRAYNNNGDTTAKLYVEKSVTKNIAVFMTAFHERGWDEMVVGPEYYFTPEMSIGIGAGSSYYMADDENAKSSHKTVSSFWYLKNDLWEAELLAERYSNDSVNPNFLELHVDRKLNENFSVGVYAESQMGWGPRFVFTFNKNFSVWVSPLINKVGDTSVISGIRVAF